MTTEAPSHILLEAVTLIDPNLGLEPLLTASQIILQVAPGAVLPVCLSLFLIPEI